MDIDAGVVSGRSVGRDVTSRRRRRSLDVDVMRTSTLTSRAACIFIFSLYNECISVFLSVVFVSSERLVCNVRSGVRESFRFNLNV